MLTKTFLILTIVLYLLIGIVAIHAITVTFGLALAALCVLGALAPSLLVWSYGAQLLKQEA